MRKLIFQVSYLFCFVVAFVNSDLAIAGGGGSYRAPTVYSDCYDADGNFVEVRGRSCSKYHLMTKSVYEFSKREKLKRVCDFSDPNSWSIRSEYIIVGIPCDFYSTDGELEIENISLRVLCNTDGRINGNKLREANLRLNFEKIESCSNGNEEPMGLSDLIYPGPLNDASGGEKATN